MSEDNVEGMKKYFRIVDKQDSREFWCLHCKRGWYLRKASSPGNYLHLLNHAYSHKKK